MLGYRMNVETVQKNRCICDFAKSIGKLFVDSEMSQACMNMVFLNGCSKVEAAVSQIVEKKRIRNEITFQSNKIILRRLLVLYWYV